MVRYILNGFAHDLGFRVFAFEGIGKDGVRTIYTVRADLALTRRYSIQVQELPLLCLAILERRDESKEQQAFIYSEADMCDRANDHATAAAASSKNFAQATAQRKHLRGMARRPAHTG